MFKWVDVLGFGAKDGGKDHETSHMFLRVSDKSFYSSLFLLCTSF